MQPDIFFNSTGNYSLYLSSQIIGYIAGVLVISYNIPQLVRMIKTKSTDDVDMLSLFFQLMLNIMYILYAILIQEIPALVSEIGAMIICLSLIILKKKYDKKSIKDSDLNNKEDDNV